MIMCDKPGELQSTVSDSGVIESDASVSTTKANPSNAPTDEGPSSGTFSEISKGVLCLSDSSQPSSQTERASTDVEDGKWPSSMSSSDSQQRHEDNSATTVHSNQASGSFAGGKHSLKLNINQPTSWKNEVPTLDTYQSIQASPPLSMSSNGATNQEGKEVTFTVGQPDTVPLEEESVESSSAMIVHKSEPPLTGDPKEDKEKIINLEAKLRDTQAKVEDLKKQLEETVREKEQYKRQLEQANETLKRVKAEGAYASSDMQQKHEREIENLRKKLADSEKQKSDQQEEYCKQIRQLEVQLKEQDRKHHAEILQLVNDKHELALKVERMNTNEERLKRELCEARLEAKELQSKLDKQESEKEINVLRSKSEQALQQKDDELQKKDDELQKKDDELRKLRQQLSSQASLSSQSSGPENNNGLPY